MFTGIVEEIGTIRSITRQGKAMVLAIGARRIVQDIKLGDSVAVNGVCLTVVSFDSAGFQADVMPETFRATTLGTMAPGAKVNLERAMAANGRFGGHLVQGHVDSTGTVVSRKPEDNAVVFRIQPADSAALRYIVAKGSITIEGISLTIVDVSENDFAVSIIPHTLAETVLQDRKAGDLVNVETDILGRYVERFLSARFGDEPRAERLTKHFLAENGFL
jgi:riboflavin synthase